MLFYTLQMCGHESSEEFNSCCCRSLLLLGLGGNPDMNRSIVPCYSSRCNSNWKCAVPRLLQRSSDLNQFNRSLSQSENRALGCICRIILVFVHSACRLQFFLHLQQAISNACARSRTFHSNLSSNLSQQSVSHQCRCLQAGRTSSILF
jgi:hypothetical protein